MKGFFTANSQGKEGYLVSLRKNFQEKNSKILEEKFQNQKFWIFEPKDISVTNTVRGSSLVAYHCFCRDSDILNLRYQTSHQSQMGQLNQMKNQMMFQIFLGFDNKSENPSYT